MIWKQVHEFEKSPQIKYFIQRRPSDWAGSLSRVKKGKNKLIVLSTYLNYNFKYFFINYLFLTFDFIIFANNFNI